MALSLNGKLSSILALLVGLRDPRIFAVMSQRGFGDDELSEGWRLFNTAAGAKLTYTRPAGLASDQQSGRNLALLDLWENTWFPIVSATLERHNPAAHKTVFNNLSQTEGRAVIVSVGTLLERTALLDKATLKLLASRGYTPEVRKEGESLLTSLKTLGDNQVPDIDPASREEQEEALKAAWAWYKEWSAIARTLFTRGDVLVRLGLRRQKRATVVEPEDDEPEKPEPITNE